MGSSASLMRHSSWNSSSACMRVLTDTRLVRWARMARVDLVDGVARRMPGPGARGARARGWQMSGLAPPLGLDDVGEADGRLRRGLRREEGAKLRRPGDGGR